jgi:Ni,Fe-hydrogenase maturation factor
MEVGTAGIRLAQELLTPYDRLVIVDAMTRGGAPGTV